MYVLLLTLAVLLFTVVFQVITILRINSMAMSDLERRYHRIIIRTGLIFLVSNMLFSFIWLRFNLDVNTPIIIVICSGVTLIFALVLRLKLDVVKEVEKIYREKPYMPIKFIANKSGATVEQAEKIINQIKGIETRYSKKDKIKPISSMESSSDYLLDILLMKEEFNERLVNDVKLKILNKEELIINYTKSTKTTLFPKMARNSL